MRTDKEIMELRDTVEEIIVAVQELTYTKASLPFIMAIQAEINRRELPIKTVEVLAILNIISSMDISEMDTYIHI